MESIGAIACIEDLAAAARPTGPTLISRRPELAALWDTERNGAPGGIGTGSHRKVWWRCGRGHSWRQKVSAVAGGSGCPYCAGKRAIPGETDLAATHPALAREWDAEKNGEDAARVTAGSARSVWWRCERGHSYEAVIYARAAGTGCPYCSGRKVLAGFNDLTVTDPELAASWDAEKNGAGPETVNRGSHKKAWWRCDSGHSYEAPIYARAAGNGCPYCAGRKVLAGFNDLATTHPAVAAQWAQELNGSVTPQTVTRGSNKKFWWRCGAGHVWQAAVFSRTRRRASDCPVCAGTVKPRLGGRYSPREAAHRPARGAARQERASA